MVTSTIFLVDPRKHIMKNEQRSQRGDIKAEGIGFQNLWPHQGEELFFGTQGALGNILNMHSNVFWHVEFDFQVFGWHLQPLGRTTPEPSPKWVQRVSQKYFQTFVNNFAVHNSSIGRSISILKGRPPNPSDWGSRELSITFFAQSPEICVFWV